MTNNPSKPKQQRAEQTRQKLIDAGIECLANYGYAGAQLGLIADIAGVSRGPRQYYFPSRIDLMMAVWEEIRIRDNRTFNQAVEGSVSLQQKVDAILRWGLDTYKTHQYLADMELKLAIRSDEELARNLTPLIEERESAIDAFWVQFLSQSGKKAPELIADRYLAVSLLRGMAIEYLVRRDHSNLAALEQQYLRVITKAIID